MMFYLNCKFFMNLILPFATRLRLLLGWLLLSSVGLNAAMAQSTPRLLTESYRSPARVAAQPLTVSLQDAIQQLEKAYQIKINYRNSTVEQQKLTTTQITQLLALEPSDLVRQANKTLRTAGLQLKHYQEKYYMLVPYNPKALPGKVESQRPVFADPSTFARQIVHETVVLEKTITGQVTDLSTDETLPGVNVVVKGTTVGTVTDIDGKYRLTAPDDAQTLVFSSVGYTRKEVAIGNQTVINLEMAPDIQSLSEVVVVGYGTQQKGDVIGSITSIDAEKLADLPVAGFEQALSGQAPGVQVSQVTGTPGGAVRIQIRGNVSVSSNSEPLYVIDGFPISVDGQQNSNPLTTINPNDIASIEVLKDASATAIYGSRASNGVVIITTKGGKSGKTRINLDAYTGFQQVEKTIDVLQGQQSAQAQIEARNNQYLLEYGDAGADINDDNDTRRVISGGDGAVLLNPRLLAIANDPSAQEFATDWQDEIFQTAPMSSMQLSASGGSDQSQFFISGNYFNQQGIVINSGFDRYTLRANLNNNLTDKVQLGLNLTTSYTNRDLVNAEGSWHVGGVVSSALMFDPTLPVLDEEGNYSSIERFANPPIVNPVQIANESTNKQRQTRLLGNIYLQYKPIEDLTLKVSFGSDIFNTRRERFALSSLPQRAWGPSQADEELSDLRNFLGEFTINYDKTFDEAHTINALVGYTAQQETFNATYIGATNFPNDYVQDLNNGVISNYQKSVQEWTLTSLLARLNYAYNSRYLLTLTARADGSSRFGRENRWGTFPSAAIGWRISEEAFLSGSDFIEDLKLRASYGLTGNNAIGNYSAIGLLSTANYSFGGTLAQGLLQQTLENEQLSWEATAQFNVGANLSILRGRLSLTADYYHKRTEDLLLQVPVPAISGFTNYQTNIGELTNKGWEIGLETYNIDNGSLRWTTNLNIYANKNSVVALGPSDDPIVASAGVGLPTHITQIGSPISSYYGYVWESIYQSQEEIDNGPAIELGGRAPVPGDVRLKDVNKDNVIDDGDQTIIGDWQPDFSFGVTNNITYKGFDLSVLIQGSIGNEIYSISKRNFGNPEVFSPNILQETFDDAWRSVENPGNGVPRLVRNQGQNAGAISSSYFVEDGSFVRIRNITLGYNFQSSFLERTRFSKLRLYASVQNAFLFTNYYGYNPEIETTTGTGSPFDQSLNPLVRGVDFGGYPLARTFTFGINASF